MPHEGRCRFCGGSWVQYHHIVEKGMGMPKKFSYLDDKYNFVEACLICHKDIHKYPLQKKDLALKIERQTKLNQIFHKNYYSPESIQKLLKYKDIQLWGLLKTLTPTANGYRREDIIRKLMGGSFVNMEVA